MPDTKITALTAIGANPIIPATFPIPMVDLTDTSMAASGTTKKVTVNQILGAGGTATLASATITGDLTVDTNVLKVDSTGNRVSVNTTTFATDSAFAVKTTAGKFDVRAAGSLSIKLNSDQSMLYNVPTGNLHLFQINDADAMTLNATGLGVGVAPQYKIHASQLVCASDPTQNGSAGRIYGAFLNAVGEPGLDLRRWDGGGGSNHGTTFIQTNLSGDTLFYNGIQASNTRATSLKMTLDASGNVGIGVAPSALWNAAFKALQIGSSNYFSIAAQNSAASRGSLLWNAIGSGDEAFVYRSTGDAANRFMVGSGFFAWYTAPSGTAGNAITDFATAKMTLTAAGDLLVGSALPVSGGRISGNSSTGPAGRFLSSAGDNQFAAMFDKSSATNTTSQFLIGFTINNQATGSGQINANGASQAAFGTFSDSRLKENIVSLPSQLTNILSLRPVEFDYKDGSGHQIGFVAQEMQEVYSDAVGEQNGFLTVTGWSKTEARLVSAIKELAAKVQALEAKLA